MITLYDYLPSQNGWKVRQLLKHLGSEYRTEQVSIFSGAGQRVGYLDINPWGAVPAIRLADGRVLSESNAILWYLSAGTAYRPAEEFAAAKVMQWLSFEADYVQSTLGSLRYWTLTGKLEARGSALVDGKRAAGERALGVLERELARREFVAGERYGIADISIYAYAHLAADAGVATAAYPAFQAWMQRVRSQPGHLAQVYPYSIDPEAGKELP
jgi:glutathione S-transferase